MQKKTTVQRKAKKLQRYLLVFALVLRFFTDAALYVPAGNALRQLIRNPRVEGLFGYLYTGSAVRFETAEKRGGTVTVVPLRETVQEQIAQEATPAQMPRLQFTAADAASIRIIGSCTYSYDTAALLAAPLKAHFTQDGPQILIVHTHTTEAYRDTAASGYQSTDLQKNVVAIGEAMVQTFAGYGITALHETGLNDTYGYSDAYERMDTVISDYLTRYPSIQMVIDVHRDSFEDASGEPAGPVVTENGQSCAKLMLVMGTDEGGLYHPNWQDNLSCALKLQTMLQKEYPSLCRDLLLRQSRYNQHQTPCSMLVEIGASGNTLEQALATARLFAATVSELILDSTQDAKP